MILAPKIPDKPNKGRVDFKMEEFRRLIQTKGLNLLWSQTTECPCAKSTTQDFSMDLTEVSFEDVEVLAGYSSICPVCGGGGLVIHSPQEIKAIFTKSEKDNSPSNLAEVSEYRKETAKLTLLPENLPSLGDIFTVKDSVLLFRETVKKTAGAVQALRFPIVNRSMTLDSGALEIGVLYLQTSDTSNNAIVGGSLVQDTDFTVNQNGELDFSICDPAKLPETGTNFSISYYINPRYKAVGSPHTIRDTQVFYKSTNSSIVPMLVQVDVELDVWSIETHDNSGA